MYITSNDLLMILDGIDDWSLRVKNHLALDVQLTKDRIELGDKILLCDLEKYLQYCESFGYTVTIKLPEIHIEV